VYLKYPSDIGQYYRKKEAIWRNIRKDKCRKGISEIFVCRKLQTEELHNLYSSPNIIRMIKSRRMRLAGHIARMKRREMHIGYWWENQKKQDH
jgi:hypothetical protein